MKSMHAMGLLLPVGLAVSCAEGDGSGDVFVPAPQGAFRLSFQSATDGGTCPIQPHVAKVGEVDEQSITELVTAGQATSDVSCTVRGTSTFELSATVARAGNRLTISLPSIDTSAAAAAPALGSGVYESLATARPYVSTTGDPCEFFFSGNAEEIASGRAWLSFRCPVVEHVSTATRCALEDGVLAVQRCKQ